MQKYFSYFLDTKTSKVKISTYKTLLFINVIVLLSFSSLANAVELISTNKIWDKAEHSAFTDLCYFKDQLICSFRTSDSHQDGQFGAIQLISSSNTNTWKSLTSLKLKGFDLRDPKLSVTKEGKLHLLFCAVQYDLLGNVIKRLSAVALSENGKNWSNAKLLKSYPNEWIWRLTWNKNKSIGYAISYLVNPADKAAPWTISLFQTENGIHFTKLKVFSSDELQDPELNEATLRFNNNNELICLLRAKKSGFIGISSTPFTDWKWRKIPEILGGPNFLVLDNDKMIATSRKIHFISPNQWSATTVVAKFTKEQYDPIITLPSGGDCSYAGMVIKDKILYISYYSSHEENTAIYFSKVSLD